MKNIFKTFKKAARATFCGCAFALSLGMSALFIVIKETFIAIQMAGDLAWSATKVILFALTVAFLMHFIQDDISQLSHKMSGQGLPAFMSNDPDGTLHPIVRLHDMSGRFFCSASVLSNKYALTAAHCLSDIDKIKIFGADLKDTGITAQYAGISSDVDIGLIVGDFSSFRKLKFNPVGFLSGKSDYAACGYPHGDIMMCAPFIPKERAFFFVKGVSEFFPGMSGGPVIDLRSGKIVAVNAAAQDSFSFVAPTVGLYGIMTSMGIKVE